MADSTPETEDWFTKKCRDPEFVKAYLEELRKDYAEDIRDAGEAMQERCAEACRDTFTQEADLTRQNKLSHGCIASAAAIRALGRTPEKG